MGSNADESNRQKEVEIIDIMEKFGKYQIIQYFFTCLATLFVTITHINYVFVAGDLNYRCRIPECDRDHAVYNTTWWPNYSIGRCTKPKFIGFVDQKCTNESFTNTFELCTEWVYETNNTVVAELDLACQPWNSNMIGIVHSIGLIIAMIFSGWMADKFGRKPAIIFFSVGSCIGHLKAFTSSYYIYISIELLEAIISGGTYTAVIVLMIEIGGKKKRILAGVLYAYGIYMGETVFALIALFVPYWKDLIRIIYSPSILLLSYVFLLRESPRWEILKGKTENVKNTFLLISKLNNVNINKQKLENMDAEGLKKEFKIENYRHKEDYRDIFKSKEILKRVSIGAFTRFSASFIDYGLMMNSVYLPGNKYINFMLTTVMSYPGELLAMYFMNKVGRNISLIYGFLICGVLCMASAFVPEEVTWLKTVFFMIGKMIVSGCFTGVVMYTMELFPTSSRGTLLGVCALTSSIGKTLAPMTPILNSVSVILPSIFFGCLAMISGALLTQTPETKNMPLMDTIQQVEYSIKLQELIKKEQSKIIKEKFSYINSHMADKYNDLI